MICEVRRKPDQQAYLNVVFFIKYNVSCVFFFFLLLRHAVTAKDMQAPSANSFLNQIILKTESGCYLIQVGKIIAFLEPSLFLLGYTGTS